MNREHEDLSRYLNGEYGFEQLPADLKRDAQDFERIVTALKRERITAPGALRERVMKQVRVLAKSPWLRVWDWVVTPKTLRLSPAAGTLAVALVLALVVLALPFSGRGAADLPSATTTTGAVTRFVFVAPSAGSVAVTGDFVDWDPNGIQLEDRRGAGVWTTELELSPGVHHYVFIIDGTEWRPDPNATSQVDDGFGQHNSVLLIPTRKS